LRETNTGNFGRTSAGRRMKNYATKISFQV